MEIITNNGSFVTDVHHFLSDDVITVITNGGLQVFDKAGMLRILYRVLHVNRYSKGIILALNDVADIPIVCVTRCTTGERAIIV